MSIVQSKNLPVVNGQMLLVYNTLRPSFSNEAKSYYTLWVDSQNGEVCLLFTPSDLALFKEFNTSKTQNYKLGYLYSEVIGKRQINTIKYLDVDGSEHLICLSTKLLDKATSRGSKN